MISIDLQILLTSECKENIMKILLSLTVSLLLFFSVSGQKRVLIEKFTNMYCGACPGGSLEIESLQEAYPQLIWVSHHKPVTFTENELTNEQSIALYNDLGVQGHPSAMVDRTEYNDNLVNYVGSWDNMVAEQLSVAAAADIYLDEVAFDAETRTFSFKVNTSFITAVESGDYRVTVMILQDYWNSKGGQSNYFNNSPGSPLEGLGDVIWDYENRNVVRAILDDHWGTQDVIPVQPEVGELYSKTYSFTAPEDYRLDRMKVVALVAEHDQEDIYSRPVLNAVEIALNDFGFQLSATEEPEVPAQLSVLVSPMPASDLMMISYPEKPSLVQLISMDGKIIYSVQPEAAQLSIDVSPYQNGQYVLLAQLGNKKLAKPISIQK